MASELAARGFDLVLVARGERALKTVADELSVRHSVRCEVLAADLTDSKGVDAVADRIREQSVTTVVNNAGHGSVGLFHELPIAEELDQIQLNVSALVALSHAALEVMVPRRSGSFAQRGVDCELPTRSEERDLRRHQGLRPVVHRGAARGGPGVECPRDCSVPGIHPHRVPEPCGYGVGKRAGFHVGGVDGGRGRRAQALERNEAVCVPGLMNKVGAASVRFAPRSVARKMAGQVIIRMSLGLEMTCRISGSGPRISGTARTSGSGARIPAAPEALVESVVVDRPALAGKRVDELDRLGLLVRGDVLPAVPDDLVRSDLGTLGQHDDRDDVLPPGPVGNPDYGGVGDTRVSLEAALDLGRVDVLRGRLDEPRLRADEGERSVGFAPAEIVGVVPVTGAALRVQLGPIEVTVHDCRPAHADLAGLALLHLVALGVEYPDPKERRGPAWLPLDGPSAPKLTSPMTSVCP